MVGQNQPINLEASSALLCFLSTYVCTEEPAGVTTERKLMTLLVSWAAFAMVQHSTQCIEYKVGPAQLQPGETLAGHMLDAALCC